MASGGKRFGSKEVGSSFITIGDVVIQENWLLFSEGAIQFRL
jgi:hypothetical protein